MGWRGRYKLWMRCDVCGWLYDVGAVVRKVYVGVVVCVCAVW